MPKRIHLLTLSYGELLVRFYLPYQNQKAVRLVLDPGPSDASIKFF